MLCFVNKYIDCLIGIIIFNIIVNLINIGMCFFFRKEIKKEFLIKKLKCF